MCSSFKILFFCICLLQILSHFRNNKISQIAFLCFNSICQEFTHGKLSKLTKIILADKLKAHPNGILIPENFLLLTKAISPLNKIPTRYLFHYTPIHYTVKSPTLLTIFPLPVFSPVKLHFRIKIGICFLRCGIVGKHMHICVCLFQHFTR